MSRADYLREWHKKNPDKNTEYCRCWNAKNIEKRQEYLRKWREAHPNHNILRLSEKRRRFRMIMAKGAKCELCGYDAFFSALQFHHLNPEEKEVRYLKEKDLDKVLLVCANCHKVIHSDAAEKFYQKMRKGKHQS